MLWDGDDLAVDPREGVALGGALPATGFVDFPSWLQ